ncbi:putative toxin-antitoxin system toxin component, PIN family [Uliginosibacterium sediminicola]|uniref:Toxin-antitoxin system toxin component, PIN family n=1 Tax=Uliginosibacterium sediminicola TaxID=2024550 RepID=A0ABU9YYF2_9RHOO
MKVKRVVIDTNVLISAALSAGSVPARVTQYFLEHGRILFSRETFAELETRLWRPKFDRYLTMEMRQALLHDFNAVADWIELDEQPEVTAVRHSRDAGDDTFIHTALLGAADMLVSGDRDLLDLQVVSGLAIRSPVDALEQIEAWGK